MAFFPRLQQQLHHHRHLHHQQQQQSITFRNFVPIDGQISAPISFFSNTSFPDASHHSFVDVMDLAPGNGVPAPAAVDGGSNGWEPRRKRLKEQDLLDNLPISPIDFHQAGSVSTGLGLSLDDRRAATSSGEPPLLLLPMIDQDIDHEVQRMDAEMDRFLKIEGERLRQSILEEVPEKQFRALASVEEKIMRKIRDKELEVEDIYKKNAELEEQLIQLAMEEGSWQNLAKYNENMINSLKYDLEQLYAQSRDSKEGCGESEVDDTASCCNGSINLKLMSKQNKDLKDSMACKVCRLNEVCMILLPCRHLCLCKECETKLSFCPLCQSSKFIGMEIYM